MPERRKTYRVSVGDACARCSTGEQVGHYWVKDVSTGGALLQGRPLPPIGTELEVLLLLPGQRPCVTDARVLRQVRPDDSPACVAVEFDDVNADVEDAIEDFIMAEFLRERRPSALIAASIDPQSEALARSLRLVGCPAASVKTPLEAIARLEQPHQEIATVFLGTQLGGVQCREFAEFLARAYPSLRRVLVSAGDPGFSSVNVHAVLPAPWTDVLVEQALTAEISS